MGMDVIIEWMDVGHDMTFGYANTLLEYLSLFAQTVGIDGRDFDDVLRDCLDLNERRERTFDRLFHDIGESLGGRPLALYGLPSQVTQSVLRLFYDRGLRAACLCDPRGVGGCSEFSGLRVVAPQTLGKDFANATVVVCQRTGDGANAMGVLTSLGFSRHQIFPWEWVDLIIKANPTILFDPSKPLNPSKQLQAHLSQYSWAYSLFEDDLSKRTVLAWLRKSLCGTPMDTPSPCEKYFEDGYIALGGREIFVDGGANSGESAAAFIAQVESAKGGYAHIYSFEPDSVHYAQALENTSKYPNVTVVQKGLWDSDTELRFLEQGTLGHSSSFSIIPAELPGTIVASVPVTSLDTFFGGVPESDWPTFIKMDIEGAEKEALEGATDTIRRTKPKMAICAYHKPEDLYVLPQTILKMRNDYRFALRQHAPELHEIILYAV